MLSYDREPGWDPDDRTGVFLVREQRHASRRTLVVGAEPIDGGRRVIDPPRGTLPGTGSGDLRRGAHEPARRFDHPVIVPPPIPDTLGGPAGRPRFPAAAEAESARGRRECPSFPDRHEGVPP